MKRRGTTYTSFETPERPNPINERKQNKPKRKLQPIEEEKTYYHFDDFYQDLLDRQILVQKANKKIIERIDERNKRKPHLKKIPENETRLLFKDRTDSKLRTQMPGWASHINYLQNLENFERKFPRSPVKKQRRKTQ